MAAEITGWGRFQIRYCNTQSDDIDEITRQITGAFRSIISIL